MAVLEEKVASIGNPTLAGMVGCLGEASVLDHHPLDPGVPHVGGVGPMSLKAVDEDGSGGKLATHLLAVMPVTQTVGVVIPGTIHAAWEKEIPNENRPAAVRSVAPGVGLSVPLIGWAEENVIGRLAVVPRLWGRILHQVLVREVPGTGSQPTQPGSVSVVGKPVLIVIGIEVHRDPPLPLIAAA